MFFRFISFLSFVVASLAFFASATMAASPSISPEQINALKALSPAQRQALASQYGLTTNLPSQSQSVTITPKPTVTVGPRVGDNRFDEFAVAYAQEEAELGLKPFGYDLFAGEPTTFEPINDVPVSSDYVLGAGDSLKVQLFGKHSSEFELLLNSKGQVAFPELGPLNLGGLAFSEAKSFIAKTVSRRMIGVKASVSMGALRSIRVFVLGDAYKPGSYVVSSLSTITNALVLSGGVAETGSLRDIQVKRKGRVVTRLDLYDLLLKGDNSKDIGLRSGDVVFIPPIGAQVEIDGQVRRPAIYEIKAGESLRDLVRYAGDFTAKAYPLELNLSRINERRERVVSQSDFALNGALTMRAGDRVFVPEVLEQIESFISVKGHIHRPGSHEWAEGVRVSSILTSVAQLKAGADLRFGLIKRRDPVTGRLSILNFNLSAIWRGEDSTDHRLQSGDELFVFDLLSENMIETKPSSEVAHGLESQPSDLSGSELESNLVDKALQADNSPVLVSEADYADRIKVVAQIIDELRYQSEIDMPSLEVEVTGSVRFPGIYPLVEGMSSSQLIYAAGGLTQQAYTLVAEVNRTRFDHLRQRHQTRLELNLESSEGLSFLLKPRDVLQIRATPEWRDNDFISLKGEVRFPGRYPIQKGDTLQTVLKRAGGVTEHAYIPGAIFTRTSLQEQEQQRLDDMRRRLSEDIAKAQLVNKDDAALGANVGVAQQLLDQLNRTPAVGRLVIDLAQVISAQSDYSLVLENGDELTIPPKRNSVSVIGEVQLPLSQIYQAGMTHTQYIESSGGTTESADDDRIYIIKANGSVLLPENSSWFSSESNTVSPGDTIVVPLDADKVDQVVLWRDLSQIFYQVALGAAAVGSL